MQYFICLQHGKNGPLQNQESALIFDVLVHERCVQSICLSNLQAFSMLHEFNDDRSDYQQFYLQMFCNHKELNIQWKHPITYSLFKTFPPYKAVWSLWSLFQADLICAVAAYIQPPLSLVAC